MSRKPISAHEDITAVEHLERCGWSNAELIWEQIQEAAAQAWLRGGRDEAADLWQGALEVANEHFAPHDLRLVTSRVNGSAVYGSSGRASRIPGGAARDWTDRRAWVSELKPVVRARSSTFHLRLRAKHRGGYDRSDMEAYHELFQQGLNQLQGQQGAAPFKQRVTQWHERKPSGFNDYRKLLAAVLLLRHPE